MFKRNLFWPLLLFAAGPLFSQSLVSKNEGVSALKDWYNKEVGNGSRIFSGREYATRYKDVADHQFFSADWEEGSVNFQGRDFEQLELKYDIVTDILLVKYFDPKNGRLVAIEPAQEKIESFKFLSFRFERLGKEITKDAKAGYYEVLVNKEYKVYARHSKEKFIDKSRGAAVVGFDHKTRIYLLKDGRFVYLRNFKSLLAEFEDKKKELKSYARSQHMIWKSNSRKNTAMIVNQYLALKNEEAQ